MALTRFTPTNIVVNGKSLVGLRPVKKGSGTGAFAICSGVTVKVSATNHPSFQNPLFIQFYCKIGTYELSGHQGSPGPLPTPPTNTAVTVVT
jgi:hypothetical protein